MAFLEKIMEKLGFKAKGRELMIKCVTSITYSMKINGKLRGHIILSRGLRQGDPLSPYLFLLYAEGLSALIKSAINSGQLGGYICLARRAKIISFFFSNDSLIFYRASLEECCALQRVL